jgi:hypothetical protein
MKKVLLTVFAGALVGATFVPVRAADDDKTFTFNGEVRGRYEYLNNYIDQLDNQNSGDPNDDSYSLGPYRVMLGITGNFTKNVSAHADLQYVGMFGDEFSPQKDIFPPVGQFFTPYLFNTQGVQLYTGWLEASKLWDTDPSGAHVRHRAVHGRQRLLRRPLVRRIPRHVEPRPQRPEHLLLQGRRG